MIPIRLNFADGTQEPVMALAVPARNEHVITAARPGVFIVVDVRHTYLAPALSPASFKCPKPGTIDVFLSEIAEQPLTEGTT